MHKVLLHYEKPLLQKRNMESDAQRKGEIVHSGHFMISSVADDQEEIEEIDHSRDSPIHHEQSIMYKYGYDFSNVDKETKDTYQFGPLSSNQITIDASLARLFQCMSLAYQGGKVVSPKWKNFKGLKLTVKDKIRLNNAIWRTWHIQYVMRKRKHQSAIQFATPLEIDTNAHSRPEAIVMEGKYWKRRIETVVAEYKKWRGFFMEKLKLSDYPGLMWVSESTSNSPSKDPFVSDKGRYHDEILGTEFTDTLFNNLSHQPFHFPNPREIAMHATNSDMIQPGLLQLQPAMEDVEFDPFQELLNPSKKAVMSFTGNTTNTPSDLFQLGDYNHVTEDQSLVAVSSLTSFNNQPMDFVGNFTNNQTQNDLPILNDSISTVDAMFSGVADVSTYYQSSGLQHDHHRPAVLHNQPTTLHNNATVSGHLHQAHLEAKVPPGNLHLQQFNQPKPNSTPTTKSTFSNVNPGVNGILNNAAGVQQNIYPSLSKHVISTPANNKITYSRTRTSQRVGFFPPNVDSQQQAAVVLEQNDVMTHAEQPLPAPVLQPMSTVSTSINPTMPQTMEIGSPIFQQPVNGVVSSDSVFLKRLLTNNVPPESTSNRRKRNSLSNATSPIQVKPNQQSSPVSIQTAPYPANNSSVSFVPVLKNPFNISEKRKKTEDNFSSLPVISDLRPQKRRTSSNSPVKPIHDVEMEAVSKPVVPLKQDNDVVQMESISRQSFSTEQKRRFNIKMGFVRLQKLLPGCSSQPNVKISKASLLTKSAQYVKTLQNERARLKEETQATKQDLEQLHHAISATQMELPATGAPVPRPRSDEGKTHFQNWVKRRAKENWKFSLFGIIVESWFESYQSNVSVSGSREFCHTFFQWLDDHCSLRQLRPNIVRSLQIISTSTCILTTPSQLKQQIESSVRDQGFDESKRDRTT